MKKPDITSKVETTSGRPDGGDFFVPRAAKLVLSDGTKFDGYVPEGQPDGLVGEAVFNTGMTGYVETLTDPSYTGQILVFTSPLLGNYGVHTPDTWESKKVHLRGVIVSELTSDWSHEGSTRSLLNWLREQDVPIMFQADTRAITKYLRTRGVMAGIITSGSAPKTIKLPEPTIVSVVEPEIINPGRSKTIIAVDCGMKENIVRSLTARGLTVKRVPHNFDYTTEDYDGVFLSNGPGDPTDYPEAIAILKKALAKNKPVFGICLGSQLMGLAAGAKTYKLRFGHRGHNQPAVMPDGRGFITSQNHGYAIDEKTLPKDWRVTFRNLNDDSVEGIEHTSKPFFSVQFHPEAAPGPTDTNWLFDKFLEML